MKVLVIPTIYPLNEKDIKGVFVVDYLKAVVDKCDIVVLDIRTDQPFAKIVKEEFLQFDTVRYFVKFSSNKLLTYLRFFSQFNKIFRSLERFDFDIIHVHGSVFHGLFGRWLSRKLKIPYIVTEHSGPFSKISGHPLFRQISKTVIGDSNQFLPVSHDLNRQVLSSGIKSKKHAVIYNPVDTSLFVPGLPKNRTSKTFVFVGRMEAYKGAFRVVQAFHQNINSFLDWRLLLIGDGPDYKRILDYSKEHDIEKWIVLLGKKTKNEIAAFLQKSHVFVYPSEHETFGLVIAEAMSAGLPVITGNLTAPKEFVDSTQGILISPKSINQIGKAMIKVVNDIETYSPKEIRSKVVNRFSFKVFGDRLYEIYQQVHLDYFKNQN